MRLGVAATPPVALPTLDWLLSSGHELARVITQPDRPAGRGRAMRESVVGQWATEHGVPVLKPGKPEDLLEKLGDLDLVITIGYGVILPETVLSIPKFGFINLHFSHLPAWRGAAPVAHAILNGDAITGVSVFKLDAGMDTGPIFVSREIAIGSQESAGELLQRMAEVGPEVVAEALELIAEGLVPTVQSADGVSYATKIHKEDARIDWTKSATVLDRQVRAFTPEPGAWTLWRGQPLQISKAHPAIPEAPLQAGEISLLAGSLFVGCAAGEALQVEKLRPAGKKEMAATQWFNGARVLAGELFV